MTKRAIYSDEISGLNVSADNIVPFFQPVYNNKTRRTEMFEALVRVCGVNADVDDISAFLRAAAEAGVYHKIQTIMLDKVMRLFGNKSEAVSINISISDITDDKTRRHIYRLLNSVESADNITFEILADDFADGKSYRETDSLLCDFIKRARRYGCKIAIDDYGLAAAPDLYRLLMLKPHYIKMGGTIIQNLVSDPVKQSLVENVLSLAATIGSQVVATHVDSAELQRAVARMGVPYSQGFYFSKALAYDSLDKYLANERKGIAGSTNDASEVSGLGRIMRMCYADKDQDQLYLGQIIHISESMLIQQVDEKTAVIHNPKYVSGWESCTSGSLVTIRYRDGEAIVRKVVNHEWF